MILRATLILLFSCLLQPMALARAESARNGAVVKVPGLFVQVQFYSDSTVRVLKWLPQGSPAKKSLVVIQNELPELKLEAKETSSALSLGTKAMTVRISKEDGSVTFLRASGDILLKENGRAALASVEFRGDKGFSLRQRFALTAAEGIYGLGQHQDGTMNYRGRSVTLVQANTQASTPFLVSTQGYGLLGTTLP
jgi:alpha-D-xyloside xylohydrolase